MNQHIAPIQAYQVDLIGKRVTALETRIRNYRKKFKEIEVSYFLNKLVFINQFALFFFLVFQPEM